MARRATKVKLQQFAWEGKDNKGRDIKGENEAPSAAYVKSMLRRQGIRPSKVRKKPKPLFQFKKPVKTKDITLATRQLATMIGAGIPVAQSLEGIARGHENPSTQELLTSIRQEVESGTSLSQSLKRYPVQFDHLYTSLVAAGEESGTLDTLLEKVATYKEKIEAIKGKIKSALLYPAAVLLVAIVVIAILLIFVIPQFESLFQGFGGELPTLTRMVVDLSEWFQEWWWLFFLVLIGGVVGVFAAYRRSPGLQYTVDRVALRLPMFGPLIQKSIVARYSRTLSTMFGAGVPLVDALESVSESTGNRVYRNSVLEVRNEVSTGRSLEAAMMQTGLFPSMVLQMIRSGEESGELELMLMKIAEFFEQEVDDAVAALSSLIEPVMIVFLGGIVGTMVVAMYLPIFKMAAVI
ncbi:MAG: Type II secretion system protein F [Gammaproteobacteria bacterium]|nr:Type II secretion system protein F [Gammaproteobacteria bacterium]